MKTQLNIREQEVVDMFGELGTIKEFLPSLGTSFEKEARQLLAALGTALDFRRGHPHPQDCPFVGRNPRLELPIFFVGFGLIRIKYTCVGVHEDGWIVVLNTHMSSQIPQFQFERYVKVVADWENTSIPGVALAVGLDRREPLKLPNSVGISDMDLYASFLEKAYSNS